MLDESLEQQRDRLRAEVVTFLSIVFAQVCNVGLFCIDDIVAGQPESVNNREKGRRERARAAPGC